MKTYYGRQSKNVTFSFYLFLFPLPSVYPSKLLCLSLLFHEMGIIIAGLLSSQVCHVTMEQRLLQSFRNNDVQYQYLSGVILRMVGLELVSVLALTGLSCGMTWPHLEGHLTQLLFLLFLRPLMPSHLPAVFYSLLIPATHMPHPLCLSVPPLDHKAQGHPSTALWMQKWCLSQSCRLSGATCHMTPPPLPS